MVKTVERDNLRNVVAAQLKSYVLVANLKSWVQIPKEPKLTATIDVSLLSLREATQTFEFLGMVETRPDRGLNVGQVNMKRVTEYLVFHPVLYDVTCDELIETRVLIETGIVLHVSRNMKQDGTIYESLNEINYKLRSSHRLQRWIELDFVFHRSLIEASQFSPILSFGELLAIIFQRFHMSIKMARWKQWIETHQYILDALRSGATGLAGDALRLHIESHRENQRSKG